MKTIDTKIFSTVIGLELIDLSIKFKHTEKDRQIPNKIQQLIQNEWQMRPKNIGKTFAGNHNYVPLFRYEGYQEIEDSILISLGETDYKETYGTNIQNPDLAAEYGDEILGNALGICSLIITSDNDLLLFKRSEIVHEKPGYWHTIGGHLEKNKRAILHGPSVEKLLTQELHEEIPNIKPRISELRHLCLICPKDSRKHEICCYLKIDIETEKLKEITLNFEHNNYKVILGNLSCIVDFLIENAGNVVPGTLAALYYYCQLRFDHKEISKYWGSIE